MRIHIGQRLFTILIFAWRFKIRQRFYYFILGVINEKNQSNLEINLTCTPVKGQKKQRIIPLRTAESFSRVQWYFPINYNMSVCTFLFFNFTFTTVAYPWTALVFFFFYYSLENKLTLVMKITTKYCTSWCVFTSYTAVHIQMEKILSYVAYPCRNNTNLITRIKK